MSKRKLPPQPKTKPRANDLAPAEIRDLEGCLKILDRYRDYICDRIVINHDSVTDVETSLRHLIAGT